MLIDEISIIHMGVAQHYPGGVTQVLVHVSTYQGSILVPVSYAIMFCLSHITVDKMYS